VTGTFFSPREPKPFEAWHWRPARESEPVLVCDVDLIALRNTPPIRHRAAAIWHFQHRLVDSASQCSNLLTVLFRAGRNPVPT
jgi:hypothetical protein